jgi:hypothetical protein
MKKIISLIGFIFTLAVINFAQTSVCPNGITITGPSGLFRESELVIFSASLSKDFENYKFEYFWTVSNGKIIDGQETLNLKVIGINPCIDDVTATLHIKGLPESCPKLEGSVSFGMSCEHPPPEPKKIDEFSIPASYISKAKFQNLIVELEDDPTATANIFETFKRGTSKTAIKQKLAQTLKFLENYPERVRIIISPGDKNVTEFWIIPAGAEPPEINQEQLEIRDDYFTNQLDKLFPPKKKTLVKKTKWKL